MYVEDQARFSISSLHQVSQDGVIYINVSEGNSIEMSKTNINSHGIGVAILQQWSLKADLKHFDKTGKDTVVSELTLMHDMETYIPIHSDSMAPQPKMEVLNSLIFLTEEHNGCAKLCM